MKIAKETVSLISILVNLLLGLLKVTLGVISNSSALVAEGIHSAIDVISSAITFLGIKIARRKPTATHPYGWGRAEVLAGFVVTSFLAVAGLGIVREAVARVLGGSAHIRITFFPLLTMLVSVFANEVLARLKIAVGQREESLALIADGKHSRVDVLSSGGVLVGLLLARFFPVADSLTALAVGAYIIYEAAVLGKEITENLLDVSDPEVEQEIRRVCAEEQINLVELKTRKIGSLTFAELGVALPPEVRVGRAHELTVELQEKLIRQVPQLEYVIIQIKGTGKRVRMLRGECAEELERVGPPKKGWRVITPVRAGQLYEDFGAPEYLVVDQLAGKEALHEVVRNPYYKIGRGHGVRFARAVQADEVRTANIGENARKALADLGIKLTIVTD